MSQKLAPKRPDEAPRTVALLKLRVNFLPEVIQLAKEVRNLKCYGFRVPLTIVNMAHQANQQYPYAIQLIESVRVYENTMQKLESQVQLAPAAHMQSVMTLVAGLRRDIQIAITEVPCICFVALIDSLLVSTVMLNSVHVPKSHYYSRSIIQ